MTLYQIWTNKATYLTVTICMGVIKFNVGVQHTSEDITIPILNIVGLVCLIIAVPYFGPGDLVLASSLSLSPTVQNYSDTIKYSLRYSLFTFLIQNEDKSSHNSNRCYKNNSKDDSKHYSKHTLGGVYKDFHNTKIIVRHSLVGFCVI